MPLVFPTVGQDNWNTILENIIQTLRNDMDASITGDANNAKLNAATNNFTGTQAAAKFRVGADVGSAISAIASGPTVVPAVLRGAASQSADLQQWQNSAGTTLLSVLNGGGVKASGDFDQNATAAGVYTGYVSATPRVMFANGTPTQNYQLDNASGTFRFFTPGIVRMQLDPRLSVFDGASISSRNSTDITLLLAAAAGQSVDLLQLKNAGGVLVAAVDNAGRSRFRPGGDPGTAFEAAVFAEPRVAGGVGTIVRGLASQTGNLQEWQSNTGAVLASVSNNGDLKTSTMFLNTSYIGARLSVVPGSIFEAGVVTRGNAGQGGHLFVGQDSAGNDVAAMTASGQLKWSNSANVQITVGGAGGAAAPPATPYRWLKIQDNAGTVLVVPAYIP